MHIAQVKTGFPPLRRAATSDQPSLTTEQATDVLLGGAYRNAAQQALSQISRAASPHIPKAGERLWTLADGRNIALRTDFRSVTATDLDTGKQLWTHHEFPESFGGLRPLRPDRAGKTLALTDAHHGVALIDGATGRVKSRIEPPLKGFITASEFTKEGLLLVGVQPSLPSGSKPLTRIFAYPEGATQPAWSLDLERSGIDNAAPSPDGKKLYFSAHNDFKMHALDLESGQIVWSKPVAHHCDPAVARDGSVILEGVAYDPETHQQRWKVEGDFVSTPIEDAQGQLYFGVGGELQCRRGDGGQLWSTRGSGKKWRFPPVIKDDAVFAMSSSDRGTQLHVLNRLTGEELAVSEPLGDVNRGFFQAGDRVYLGLKQGYVSMDLPTYSLAALASQAADKNRPAEIVVGEDRLSVGGFELDILD
ncbi:MAG: PQQ-binding-like beta-propeller repeat protein [Candidatus Eremiobacteraeota bacterium]|nr:PQQ-binding-like beta-propeller repeat protein [Candidatus Eremiobacteraeota bacterium]